MAYLVGTLRLNRLYREMSCWLISQLEVIEYTARNIQVLRPKFCIFLQLCRKAYGMYEPPYYLQTVRLYSISFHYLLKPTILDIKIY